MKIAIKLKKLIADRQIQNLKSKIEMAETTGFEPVEGF